MLLILSLPDAKAAYHSGHTQKFPMHLSGDVQASGKGSGFQGDAAHEKKCGYLF